MKLKLILLFFMVVSISFAQIKLEGVVKDSIGNPLELANVVAINQETKALDSYGITNSDGRYLLNVKKNVTYKIQASYVGMKMKEAIVETKEIAINKDFSLTNDNALDEVELVYEIPVTIKGDTLIYNADSFKNETDKKLEDVLNKLPGVEVNEDGEIEVEGKRVTKVMVEGKDFFDGDSKLATKNIPANALDKIQVLKNYAEVGQLRNVRNNQDNIAINIKLKEGKKNFWFGDVTAGSGVEVDLSELYTVTPKLFYYSPDFSLNTITNFNNIGEVAFTRRDYFNFTGGFRGAGRNSGTSFNVASTDIGFLTMQNNRANAIETRFVGTNFSYSPKKTWDLSGYAIYSGNKTQIVQNSSRVYNQQGNNNEQTKSAAEQKSDLGLFKLSSSYKPNTNNHLDYDVFLRFSKQSENKEFFSSILQNIDEIQEQNPYSINQNLNYYYTLNEKNIFATEVQYLIQDEDPFYNAVLENVNEFRFSETLGLDAAQPGYNVVQDKRIKTNKFDGKIDYWNVINNKSNINFTIGALLSAQRFNSKIYQILENGTTFTPTNAQDNILNDIEYHFSDVYTAAHYTLKLGKFTFTPGVSLHAYQTKNSQFGSEFKDEFVRLLPDFDTRIQLKKSESLSFKYTMTNSFTNVNQLAEALVFNNYNAIFKGNRALENSLSHNLNLSYFSFNMFNYTNVFAFINYSKRIDQIRNQSRFLPNTTNQISVPFNSTFADETVRLNGRVERTFGRIKASLRGNFSFSKFNQFINGQRRVNESFTQQYRSRISTNFREAPNVHVGYNLTINDYMQGIGDTKFFTHSPFVNFDAYILKRFTFKSNYSFNDYRNNGNSLNTYSFLDASLGYQKKDSQWEYKLRATNLLNTTSLNTDTINNLFTSTSEYFIQPRYVVFSVKYNL